MAKRHTTEEFIKGATKTHFGYYKYDKTVYKGIKDKIEIFCPKCKEYFWQIARNHKNGAGCPICNKKIANQKKSQTKEDFINKCISVHGDKYNYSKVLYTRSNQKVKIWCNTCNEYFWQEANAHKQGHGCRNCNLTGRSVLGTEEFIKRSIKLHGDKYDYSKVVYKKVIKKVKIYCNQCKKYFLQSPVHHLEGKGHKMCCSDTFSPARYGKAHKKAILYIIRCFNSNESFYKIGITSKDISKRFNALKEYEYEILCEQEMSGYDARHTELKLHEAHKEYRYIPSIEFGGYTECFNHVDFNLVNLLFPGGVDVSPLFLYRIIKI